MIKNFVILIPNISRNKQVCDYLEQTADILDQYDNKVFIIYHDQSFSIKEIIVRILAKQKPIISKKINNIYYLYPIHLIPFKRFRFIKNINTVIYSVCVQLILKIKYFDTSNYLVWMFFPQLVQFIKIKLPFWKIIYDIVDFHTSPSYQKQKQLDKKKQFLLKKSNFIVANSHSLKNKYKFLTQKQITVVPQGFDYSCFNKKNGKTTIKLASNKPLIGFVGQISQRFDFKLLKKLISQNQQWNFVFVGPKHHEANIASNKKTTPFDKIIKNKNCTWFRTQPRSKIPAIIQQLDVCIIPYDVYHDFNRYCYPMKLFEYFYMRKPVVSTPVEELKQQKFKDLIKIGSTAKEWEVNIKDLLDKPWSKKNQQKQKKLAIDNSWKNKIETISKVINDTI